MSDTGLTTYEVTVTHPDLSGPLVLELVASSPGRAITRARMATVNAYRDLRLMDAAYTVTRSLPGVWPDGRNSGRPRLEDVQGF